MLNPDKVPMEKLFCKTLSNILHNQLRMRWIYYCWVTWIVRFVRHQRMTSQLDLIAYSLSRCKHQKQGVISRAKLQFIWSICQVRRESNKLELKVSLRSRPFISTWGSTIWKGSLCNLTKKPVDRMFMYPIGNHSWLWYWETLLEATVRHVW